VEYPVACRSGLMKVGATIADQQFPSPQIPLNRRIVEDCVDPPACTARRQIHASRWEHRHCSSATCTSRAHEKLAGPPSTPPSVPTRSCAGATPFMASAMQSTQVHRELSDDY